YFFFQAEDGIRDFHVTGVQTCALPISYKDQMLTRWAKHMASGAERYEDRNWEQFSDWEAYDRAKASAFRHFMQWMNGEQDEDHAAAIFFNVMAAEYVQGRIEGKW